jgi:hypothetical protein
LQPYLFLTKKKEKTKQKMKFDLHIFVTVLLALVVFKIISVMFLDNLANEHLPVLVK